MTQIVYVLHSLEFDETVSAHKTIESAGAMMEEQIRQLSEVYDVEEVEFHNYFEIRVVPLID